LFFILTSHCASLFEEYDEKLLQNKEFDNNLKIQEIPAKPEELEAPAIKETPAKEKSKNKEAKVAAKPEKKEVLSKSGGASASTDVLKKVVHEPSIEDGEGFYGRRPLVDPFVEKEELTYAVSYFAVEAGRFTMKTNPFVQVNGKKAYHFTLHARSSSVFSLFYAVDDVAESFLDYEDLIAHSYTIKAKESKQVRDVKSFFNWKTMKAKTWDKKIKKGKDVEEKVYEWDVLPYSQNVFTVAYYMRCFQYKVGKDLSVRVAHEGKNMVMTAKVLREEKLKTAAGVFDTFVIKPEFEIDGVFKPVGDVFMWITKDAHHRIARIESKIKIGKIVANLQQISP
jgi:hypothetical protein